MTRSASGDIVREVSDRIDVAIKQNRQHERIIVTTLVLVFAAGLGLLVYGAVIREWQLLIPGGILQMLIVFPIRRLMKLREDNMRLQILPQLLRLADSREAKELAARLASRLIERV